MKIRTWGCRGSIATPGLTTLRYGGNSTCVEIRPSTGQTIIIDAGSGLRNLGSLLIQEKETAPIRFFFTHSHWDHLVGFPFFRPAYLEQFSIGLCSGPHAEDTMLKSLNHQMTSPFFPVDFRFLKAKFEFRCEREHGEYGNCRCHGLEISQMPLNHPDGGYGYKFMENGKTFVFLPDNELGFRHEGGLSHEQYVEFCRGADLLFHDAQYTDQEYMRARGWGHSTFGEAVDLALEARVKCLVLFHHDPDRTDEDLDRQVQWCRERIRMAGSAVQCYAAKEGTTIEL
ncbi:MAG: MBL fold metallo-hydrolase [Deltaproteobacteria bacterium HGW-Deltaproteobacteria-15]|jgi:phosphoribosyl 1,2-cyclic phosphodiesterase|nr:MAG: MBL fold metallo-hydrolase [Deltaproteobacteria bacterium HGW-Deltaproteobacteria-15]